MSTQRVALCSLFFLIAALPLTAQGSYKQIDYPGAVQTFASSINAAGDVVGMYIDTSNFQHGFLLSGGNFTTIDDPNGGWTFLTGINDNRKIVGYGTIAFLYDIQSQVFTNIGIDGLYTHPLGINNLDTVVGFVLGGNPHNLLEVGFELFANGQTKRIAVPGASNTDCWGVSTSGIIVGFTFGNSGFSFAFNGDQYKLLSQGIVLGINPQGTAIVGYNVGGGFLYQNNTLTTIRVIDAKLTIANGVNRVGQVVGYFRNLDESYHGFVWTPATDAAH